MTGERCPHCHGWVASPRRGLDIAHVWRVHQETCPGVLRVRRSTGGA